MNLRNYLSIKTAGMQKKADDAEDRRDYKLGKKELEKTLDGFERTLFDETTYPGYGYTQDMLGPYGRVRSPKEYIGSIPSMPHIPHTYAYHDDDDDTLHAVTGYYTPTRLKLGPLGAITEQPTDVFYDRNDSKPAGWASTDLGIKNPSFFGRLWRKTINNPHVSSVSWDMMSTLDALKYYYRYHPEEYKQAVRAYGRELSRAKARGSEFNKEVDDFNF